MFKNPVTINAIRVVTTTGYINSNLLAISRTIIEIEKLLLTAPINAPVAAKANIFGLIVQPKTSLRISPYNLPNIAPMTNPGINVPKGMAEVVKTTQINSLTKMQ